MCFCTIVSLCVFALRYVYEELILIWLTIVSSSKCNAGNGFVATWLLKDYRNFNLEPGLRGKDEKIIVSSPELVDADME